MRDVVNTGIFSWEHFFLALGLNALYLAGFGAFYLMMLERGRENGRLVRITS